MFLLTFKNPSYLSILTDYLPCVGISILTDYLPCVGISILTDYLPCVGISKKRANNSDKYNIFTTAQIVNTKPRCHKRRRLTGYPGERYPYITILGVSLCLSISVTKVNTRHITYLKLSAQPYGQPNAKYVHFCTCTRYLMCT